MPSIVSPAAAIMLPSYSLDDLGKAEPQFLPLQDCRVGVHDPRNGTADTHQEREAIEGRVRDRDDGVPINDSQDIELSIDKDVVRVEVVVGKAKSLDRAIPIAR
ncbi:d2b1158d-db02-4d60-a557-6d7418a738d3 [Thermothielavioides terrestris]|uniref:D2b1158d-db02-4d60-a557-6d7418a738d3 n=1 Tax=Thermothielavioides terrestris TaxID=2587410 RepID=A0A3S5CWK5_9PEZI|nr:d2b1158d-db02-4d60-a557-6d7418a738d3 [Thermothielavioides terrestris]